MTVGEKLQELIDWNSTSQTKLAQVTGISQSTISEYTRDTREPSLEALRKLAAALDVSVWTIINGEPLAITPLEITEDECRVVAAYRSLSVPGRELVHQTLRTLIRQS